MTPTESANEVMRNLLEKQNKIVEHLHVANKILKYINKQYNYKNMADYREELLKQSEVQRTVVEKWLEKLRVNGEMIHDHYEATGAMG